MIYSILQRTIKVLLDAGELQKRHKLIRDINHSFRHRIRRVASTTESNNSSSTIARSAKRLRPSSHRMHPHPYRENFHPQSPAALSTPHTQQKSQYNLNLAKTNTTPQSSLTKPRGTSQQTRSRPYPRDNLNLPRTDYPHPPFATNSLLQITNCIS